MPVDIVKVLKTQDENYVRTMRSAGLKVRSFIHILSQDTNHRMVQKISKLKRQLTTLADLVKPGSLDRKTTDEGDNDNDLDDNELRILHDAGIVSGSNIKGQGRGKPPKHIVFVDNEQAGAYITAELESSADWYPQHDSMLRRRLQLMPVSIEISQGMKRQTWTWDGRYQIRRGQPKDASQQLSLKRSTRPNWKSKRQTAENNPR